MSASRSPDPLPPRGEGIIGWFARNGVAANLLMLVILAVGLASAVTIQKEFFPQIEADDIVITVPYRGAAPQEVEEGVVVRIEEEIEDVTGIKRISSRAREGNARVEVESNGEDPLPELLDRVKVRVDSISTFPAETERPVIFEERFEDEVIWVSLFGDVRERDIKELGRTVRDEIIALPDVTKAQIFGTRNYEISIEVSEKILREYGLTFEEVVAAVRSSSLDLPAGEIDTPGGEIVLRTKGQAYTGADFSEIVLLTREDGTRLLVGDVAHVVDGFEDVASRNMFNGQRAVSIAVRATQGESFLDIAAEVRAYVERKQKELPEGMSIAYSFDRSVPLKDRLNLMFKNAFFGGLLVFASLALFLRLRLAFWVMVGLPVAFLGATATLPFVGVTINMLSLFGFILVLGIVVDDAIVIGENIYTRVRRDGQSVDNVIAGAKDVALPATFGVLTTMVAFIPILMIPGRQGDFWAGIAWVVILALLFSLVESKLILPAHLAHMKPADGRGRLARFQRWFADGLEGFIVKVYQPFLDLTLKYRYLSGAIFTAVLILAVGMVANGIVRWVWFPNIPSNNIRVGLTMTEGTPKEVTMAELDRIDAIIGELDAEYAEEAGEGFMEGRASWMGGENVGNMIVELVPSEERDIGTLEVVRQWRERVGRIPGATNLNFSGTIGRAGDAIDFELSGTDYEQLNAVAAALKEKLAGYEHVFDIRDSFTSGKREIRLDILPSAEVLGITRQDLARQVRYAFYGAEAQRIQRGRDDVRVMVRYPEEERRSIGSLENMRIRAPSGEEVPFAAVAEATYGQGYSTIRRVDRKRVINVTADVDKARAEPGKIITEVEQDFLLPLLARYPGVSYKLEGESREQAETGNALLWGALLTLFLIYCLLAIPLKSYVKPFIIMAVIPFGIVGAILGLWLMGLPVSILAVSGIIALSGVVVNDSLVMVDFINKHERENDNVHDAVVQAGAARFRAILLTSLTTFLGLVPILSEQSLQAQFLKPMAAAVAFGILFATVITLLLVPCLYMIREDLINATSALRSALSGSLRSRQANGSTVYSSEKVD